MNYPVEPSACEACNHPVSQHRGSEKDLCVICGCEEFCHNQEKVVEHKESDA